jgi:uncharacterized membrane protein YfcA
MGSLIGLGGATFLVPIYVLFLGMPIQYTAGASLISIIATSSGADSAYVRDRLTNMWIGMSLEIATTSGSIVDSLAAAWVYIHRLQRVIYILFGVLLLGSIYTQVTRSGHELPDPKPPDRWIKWLQLCGLRWWLGELIMFAAGVVSGLLGIGSGALKVVAMDRAMNLPIKVSTATSNFMIGVTAVADNSIDWSLGYTQPFFAATTVIGVLAGSFMGSKVHLRLRSATMRHILTVTLAALGIQMLLRGLRLC